MFECKWNDSTSTCEENDEMDCWNIPEQKFCEEMGCMWDYAFYYCMDPSSSGGGGSTSGDDCFNKEDSGTCDSATAGCYWNDTQTTCLVNCNHSARQSSETCPSEYGCNWDNGTAECTFADDGEAEPECGNGNLEEGEQCDGSDYPESINGCTDVPEAGFTGGTLGCSGTCTLDTSSCTSGGGEPVCNNGILEEGEECDGDLLNSKTCITQGFDGGTLGCSETCTFATANCTGGDEGGLSLSLDQGIDLDAVNISSTIDLWTTWDYHDLHFYKSGEDYIIEPNLVIYNNTPLTLEYSPYTDGFPIINTSYYLNTSEGTVGTIVFEDLDELEDIVYFTWNKDCSPEGFCGIVCDSDPEADPGCTVRCLSCEGGP